MSKTICRQCTFYRCYAVVVPRTSITRYHKCFKEAQPALKENFVTGHKWIEYAKAKECSEQNKNGKCVWFEKASWWCRFWNTVWLNSPTKMPK